MPKDNDWNADKTWAASTADRQECPSRSRRPQLNRASPVARRVTNNLQIRREAGSGSCRGVSKRNAAGLEMIVPAASCLRLGPEIPVTDKDAMAMPQGRDTKGKSGNT
jgi:hypothetical protein